MLGYELGVAGGLSLSATKTTIEEEGCEGDGGNLKGVIVAVWPGVVRIALDGKNVKCEGCSEQSELERGTVGDGGYLCWDLRWDPLG